MRIIHTADWHLGQVFHGYDRYEEHARFLAWLLDTLVDERADALLVAGDIYDHANPSATSQRQLYGFLADAQRVAPGLQVVLIAGNHDAPARLEAPAPLLGQVGAVAVGQVPRQDDGRLDAERLCIPLRDATGHVAAWCLAVPFLRSIDLTHAVLRDAGPDTDGTAVEPSSDSVRSSSYRTLVQQVYERVLATAQRLRTDGTSIVALGHCHMEGTIVSSDSERAIVAGGLEALPRSAFDPSIAYVGLGHLHRAQTVAGDERVRYAGSPMPLSFSETCYTHQVMCVDITGGRLAAVRPIVVPRFVGLLRVPDVPAPIEDVFRALRALDVPASPTTRQPYLEVRVALDGPEPGLRARIEEALADRPVRLARIDVTTATRDGEANRFDATTLGDLARLAPLDVLTALHRDRFGQDPPDDLRGALGELMRDLAAEERP